MSNTIFSQEARAMKKEVHNKLPKKLICDNTWVLMTYWLRTGTNNCNKQVLILNLEKISKKIKD